MRPPNPFYSLVRRPEWGPRGRLSDRLNQGANCGNVRIALRIYLICEIERLMNESKYTDGLQS